MEYEQRRAHAVAKMLEHLQAIRRGDLDGQAIDMEFSEQDGLLCVTRLLNHQPASDFVTDGELGRKLETRVGDSKPRRLTTLTPGNLGTLCWEAMGGDSSPPSSGPDELIVDAKAFSIAPRHLDTALGRSEQPHFSTAGFSGIVTAVGCNYTKEFQANDRVCGAMSAGFVTSGRVKAAAVRKTSLSLASAAAISDFLPTVSYALSSVARIQRGEAVLICVASPVLRDMAVQYVKYLGAEALVLSENNTAESIPSLGFADVIQTRTGGKGIDAIVWCGPYGTARQRRELGSCMAFGGRIVEVSQCCSGAFHNWSAS